MYHDGASKPCTRLGKAPVQRKKLGGRSEAGEGNRLKGFVSQVEGAGIKQKACLYFRNHSDCTVENGWKRGNTRARKPVRGQF